MRRIRVLVDSHADEGLTNAQMSNAREIVRRLNSERFEISIFHRGAADPRLVQRPNTRLVQLPQRRQTVTVLREFLWGKHDILFYLKVSPAARLYLSLRGILRDRRPIVGTIESQCDFRNEPTIKPEDVRYWEHTILRCDYLFSNSHSVKKSLQAEYGASSEVVPTGVDARVFTPDWKRPPNARPRVLFVGSLRPFKGPQLLLQAAPRFPDADFVVVGDGMLASELAKCVERERLANVRLTGSLEANRLREEYQRADVFLFPSRWEGSPKVILEAAACGLPVIARKDYEPETVIDGQTGYVVASDDEVFVRLGELLRRPELRRSLGQAGRKHAERFDWDQIVRRWEEIFLSLMSQRADHRVP